MSGAYVLPELLFYSHVNYSVTKITLFLSGLMLLFYSHVNYSVTKITIDECRGQWGFTVT